MSRTRKKSHVRELGSEFRLKTELWEKGISEETAQNVDRAVSKDEYVIADGNKDAHLIEKVLSLEIKRWKVVTQLTNKIVSQLDDKELAIVVHGHNKEDPGSIKYLFRKLCEKHKLDTGYVGVSNSPQKKADYYALKSGREVRRGTLPPLSLDELCRKLEGDYILRAGENHMARDIVVGIIKDVRAMLGVRCEGVGGYASDSTSTRTAPCVPPMELINASELAKKLLCCVRTINRAVDTGDLSPCSSDPLLFEKGDVLEFLNKRRKGMAAQLAEIPGDFLSTIGVAEELKIKPNTLRLWLRKCDKNNLPHFRMSKTWVLFRMADVGNWFKNRRAIIYRLKHPETLAEWKRKVKAYYKSCRA